MFALVALALASSGADSATEAPEIEEPFEATEVYGICDGRLQDCEECCKENSLSMYQQTEYEMCVCI